MTFVDDVLQGRADIDDIDEYRESWNSSAVKDLHDYLGLLWPEYAMWVEEGQVVLEYVIKARQERLDLRSYLVRNRQQDPASEELWRLAERYAEEWEKVRS
ncbi:hypothetical protein ABT099_32520 [Streptomyces prasinus]|uniref:hypothetical protein n=1 Tax=Streptomyces prasinus TaxID=67345 RepID=UPI0033280B4E